MTLSVLQVNASDAGGGAEAVALGLHHGLRGRGVNASLAVGYRRTNGDGVLEISGAGSRRSRLLRDPGVLVDLVRGREDFRFPPSRGVLGLPAHEPSVLHLHNLHGGFFDLTALPELAARVPTVVTMHDEWLYTGHCAYTLGCERWQDRCGLCPHLGVYPGLRVDGTAGNRRRKAALYAETKAHVVSPSAWLLERAERSMLAPAIASARVVPNGVDLTAFRPGGRRAARSTLGIESDAFVVLFAAQGARTNPYKDFATLRAALDLLSTQVISIQLGEAAAEERVGKATIRSEPFVERARVAAFLQAADLYVHATRADNHPLAVLEALACGVPVVAPPIGGIAEQLTERTGVLVEEGDAAALAHAIDGLAADPERRARMGEAAAADARARFDLERQVDAYLDLYRELAEPC
jgi:glycosyltransferase involved in cell wall biosynthesis